MTTIKDAPASHNPNGLLKEPQRFSNLRAGGRELASRLETYRSTPDLLVLGIALGGLQVAHEVAQHLAAPLDFIVIRRLLVPSPDTHQCAVSVAGSLVIDDDVPMVEKPSTPLEYFLHDALAGLAKRAQICRRQRPAVSVEGRNVLLVDCGIRTGSTMRAAAKAVRRLKPKQLIGAVPVASREGFAAIASLYDELICLAQPEQFINAGYWYRDFNRPGDDAAGELLEL